MNAILIDGEKTFKFERGVITENAKNSTFIQFGERIIEMDQTGELHYLNTTIIEEPALESNLVKNLLEQDNIFIGVNETGKADYFLLSRIFRTLLENKFLRSSQTNFRR